MKVTMIKSNLLEKLVACDRIRWQPFAEAVRKTDSRFAKETWLEPEGVVTLIDDLDMFLELLETEGYMWDIHRYISPERVLYLWKPLNNSGGTSYYVKCRGMREIVSKIKDA